MSRVFDALKQAGSLRETGDSKAAAGIWTALGVGTPAAAAPVQAAEEEAAAPLARASAAATATAMVETVPEIEPAAEPAHEAHIKLDRRARLIPHTTDHRIVEHYRMLRTKILQEREKQPFRSILVTSANPQEGKSVTVLNLALSFAALPGFRVLLVDGDMRKGSVGEWLGMDGSQPGLSNLMDGSARLEDVILRSPEFGIHFLVRGNSQVNDIQASRVKTMFDKMQEQFDLVLVDSPPVNLLTDAQLLAESCDAVLLVARAFKTTRKALEQAVQNLRPFRLIGTVLNGGTVRRAYKYYGYY